MPKNINNFVEIYDLHYRDKNILKQKVDQAQYFVKRLKFNPFKGAKIFEPGCGSGVFGSYIKKRFGVSVFGMDLSKTAIAQSQKRGLITKKGDLNSRWPYKSETFDYVTSSQVIEHILDTDNFIKESKRILKKDGFLCISTPNLASWFNRIIFLFGYQPFFLEISNEDKTLGLKFTQAFTQNRKSLGHIRVFTLVGLIDLLEYHGFKVENKYGGAIEYLPNFMKPFDRLFSNFPSLASDLFIVAAKKGK